MIWSGHRSAQATFLEEGVLLFPQVFEGEELARLRLAAEHARDRYLEVIDARHSAHRNVHQFFQVHDPRLHAQTREHLLTVLETAADPRCLGPVEQVFKGRSLFRCTTLFFNPRYESSEGNWHRDMQFLLATEEELRAWIEDRASAGRPHPVDGVQFQVALVDSDDIEYVPFSAGRYDSPAEYRLRRGDGGAHSTDAGMPNAVRISQRAGDAVMFNPHGIHRGRYHADIPRLTLMFTYTPRVNPRADEFVFQPWMLEPGALDGLSPRARLYYEDFIEVYRERLRMEGVPLTFPGDS